MDTSIILNPREFCVFPVPILHIIPMVRNLTPDCKVFAHGKEFSEEEKTTFARNGMELLTSPVKEIQHENGKVKQVVLEDGTTVPLKALYAPTPFEVNGKSLMEELGCDMDDKGYLKVDGFQKTSGAIVQPCCVRYRRQFSEATLRVSWSTMVFRLVIMQVATKKTSETTQTTGLVIGAKVWQQ